MSACIPANVVALLKERVTSGQVSPDEVARMLPSERAELKAILEEFVAQKLGVSVSNGEVTEIQARAKAIDVAQQTLGDHFGEPEHAQEHIAFFAAKAAMDDYLQSKHPAPNLRVLTGTIGRGMMLFSVKSPVLNVGSNIEVGFTEVLARRLAGGGFQGADNQLARDYVQMVHRVYQATGADLSRMTTLRDTGAGGERVLGHTVHAQGPGPTRYVGRIIENIVFKQLMGAPDVVFAAAHFADSVNTKSLQMAHGDRPQAVTWMRDAMRLEPQTPEGEVLRTQAILDAQTATWTGVTWASRISTGIRKIINDVSGDTRIGDYLLPFIITPANVIATGMDYAGLGIPKAFFATLKAMKSGDAGSAAHLQTVSRQLIRSGLGLIGAFLIASLLDDDDFVGAYDPARAQIEQLRNSQYNAFRVGDKWISTNWLGPLSVSVTALMYARKYGKGGPEQVFQYGKGVLSTATQIPGVADIYDQVKQAAYQKNQSLEELSGATVDYLTAEVYSRLVPSFASDLAKAFDPYVRQGGKGLAGVKIKIPGVSQTAPRKQNIFGEDVHGESALTDILFGSRVKTDRETPLIRELDRVATVNDKSITFTNWAKTSSKKLAQFKEKVGEERYNTAARQYGQELQKQLTRTINQPSYVRLSDADKLSLLNNMDSTVLANIFQRHRFRYQTTTRRSRP